MPTYRESDAVFSYHFYRLLQRAENVSQGFFELDWNEQFVDMLIENGYTGTSPEETVNSWFTDVCRGIIREESADDFIVDEDIIRTSDLNKKELKKTKDD